MDRLLKYAQNMHAILASPSRGNRSIAHAAKHTHHTLSARFGRGEGKEKEGKGNHNSTGEEGLYWPTTPYACFFFLFPIIGYLYVYVCPNLISTNIHEHQTVQTVLVCSMTTKNK